MSAKILKVDFQIKKNIDSITYDDVISNRYRDLYFDIREYQGHKVVECRLTMDAKVWKSYQKAGYLGTLYNLDLSNYLYRKHNIMVSSCSVYDGDRVSKGKKRIRITFDYRGQRGES